MASLNKVMLIGRLTSDPDAPRTMPRTGNQVVSFRFAVGRSRKNAETGQWESDPNPLYIDCEAWSFGDNTRLVDLVTKYLRKGSQIYLEGRLQLDSWEQDGQKRSKHRINVSEIQFLDSNREDGGESRGGGLSESRNYASSSSRGRGRSGYDEPQSDYDGPPSRGGGGGDGGDEDIPF